MSVTSCEPDVSPSGTPVARIRGVASILVVQSINQLNPVRMIGATSPAPAQEAEERIKEAFEKNWNVIVWNDPVNQMSYVVYVFMRVLAFSKQKATKRMLEVHHKGRSCVATETREKAELYHHQLQSCGLSVTIEES